MTSTREVETTLDTVLRQEGLDIERWKSIFKEVLGVTMAVQIKHVNKSSFKSLVEGVTYDWEINALKKIFGIPPDNAEREKELQEKIVMKTKQTHRTRVLSEELEKLNAEVVKNNNDVVAEEYKRMRQDLCKPDDKMVRTNVGASYESAIEKVKPSRSVDNLNIIPDMNDSDNELLAKASSGFALRGISVGKSDTYHINKNIVLDPPETVKWMKSSMKDSVKWREFSTKNEANEFRTSMDMTRNNLQVSAKGSCYGVKGEGSYSQKYNEDNAGSSTSESNREFYSRIEYHFVPMAACQFDCSALKLSREVLDKLIAIEKCTLTIDDKDERNSKYITDLCSDFFESFGSHISKGIFHFGGTRAFVVEYESRNKMNLENTKKMTADALSVMTKLCWNKAVFNVEGSVSTNAIKSAGCLNDSYTDDELSKTHTTVSTYGGSSNDSTTLWKQKLTDKRTWAIIHWSKDVKQDLLGIWELISNHPTEFSDFESFKILLEDNWKNINCLSNKENIRKRNIELAIKKFDQMLNSLDSADDSAEDSSEESLLENFVHIVKNIYDVVMYTENITECNNYLSNNAGKVEDFFLKVVRLEHKMTQRQASYLRRMLKSLDSKFKFGITKREVVDWMKESNTCHTDTILDGVESIPGLINMLKYTFLPSIEYDRSGKKHDILGDGINVLTTAVNRLLINLNIHQVILLRTVLLNNKYDCDSKIFINLTLENLRDFIDELEKNWETYEGKIGNTQKECYVLHQLLITLYEEENTNNNEKVFIDMIQKIIEKSESNEVSTQICLIKEYAFKSPFDWRELIRITNLLPNGNVFCPDKPVMKFETLRKIFSSHKNRSDSLSPDVSHDTFLSDDYDLVLDRLRLKDFYPSKISFKEAISLRKSCKTINGLPWLILTKLLMNNYNARDSLFSDISEIKEETNCGTSWYDDSEEISKQSYEKLHPMDVLLVLFACCDYILKQVVAQKLFVCRLAIPFLYSIGCSKKFMISLWALRSIVIEWKDKIAHQMTLTEQPLYIVSFIRLGKFPISKSKLINNILSETNHNTFFSRDCPHSNASRNISNGLVECACFLPSQRNNIFKHVTMFLNLRGDCAIYKLQLDFLKHISSVMVIMINVDDMKMCTEYTDIIADILNTGRKILLLHANKKQTNEMKTLHSKLEIKVSREKMINNIILVYCDKDDGSHKLKENIQNSIEKLLSKENTKILENCFKDLKYENVLLDENILLLKKSKDWARNVIEEMKEDGKTKLLPLQGVSWVTYNKNFKKKTRSRGSASLTTFKMNSINDEMMKCRQDQLHGCNNLLPFTEAFLHAILKCDNDGEVALYFFQWLNIFLNNISRSKLPKLYDVHQNEWDTYRTELLNTSNKSDLTVAIENLKNAKQNIIEASLGLENMFRELGQIYEAMIDHCLDQEMKENVNKLPDIVAKAVLDGIPLELMDGDASGVPTKWIKAVLNSLKKTMREKKILVVSVIGVQSSGKSTLLNTMFGLQFPVSAGRCTRGVFLQLVPVTEQDTLSFEYLAVLDTEGLRASELKDQMYMHDNELATLAVGLADVSIINIKGSKTEIAETLQIVIHALLRMNLCNMDISHQRSCIITDQNNESVNSENHRKQEIIHFSEELDEKTCSAARIEKISDIKRFSEIINFDVHEHVWYLHNLWHGDPPMAPANIGYSEDLEKLKVYLTDYIPTKHSTYICISEFSSRLNNLWNALLTENFVFSFKNIKSIEANNNLEQKFFERNLKIITSMAKWLEVREIQITKCQTKDSIREHYKKYEKEFQEFYDKQLQEHIKEVETYIETHKERTIMVQWKESQLRSLKEVFKNKFDEGMDKLKKLQYSCTVDLSINTDLEEKKELITRAALDVGEHLSSTQGEGLSANEIKLHFAEIWTKLIDAHHIMPEKTETIDIHSNLENILRFKFQSYSPNLNVQLNRHPLNIALGCDMLTSSTSLLPIEAGDISTKLSWKKNDSKLISGLPDQTETIIDITEIIFQEIDRYLKSLPNESTQYSDKYPHEILQIITNHLQIHNEKDENNATFTITSNYEIKLAVHIFRHCLEMFNNLQTDYENKYGINRKIDKFKETTSRLFTHTVRKSAEDVIVADLICCILWEPLCQTVLRKLPYDIFIFISSEIGSSNYQLIRLIMADLATQGNFDTFMKYIRNPNQFIPQWISQYIDKKVFNKRNETDHAYFRFAKKHIQTLIDRITFGVYQSTEKVTTQSRTCNKTKYWITTFCELVDKEISIHAEMFHQIHTRVNVDFDHLHEKIVKKLNETKKNLEEHFKNQEKSEVQWADISPVDLVMDAFRGCTELCPLCQEICCLGKHHTISHQCLQHRPKGVSGISWLSEHGPKEGTLVIDSCSDDARTDTEFSCMKISRIEGHCLQGKEKHYHPYEDFTKYFPKWNISQNLNNETYARYWKWFMKTYIRELAKYYNKSVPIIPSHWKNIEKEEVINSLRES